jgi:hypothetical protein
MNRCNQAWAIAQSRLTVSGEDFRRLLDAQSSGETQLDNSRLSLVPTFQLPSCLVDHQDIDALGRGQVHAWHCDLGFVATPLGAFPWREWSTRIYMAAPPRRGIPEGYFFRLRMYATRLSNAAPETVLTAGILPYLAWSTRRQTQRDSTPERLGLDRPARYEASGRIAVPHLML